MGSKLIPNSLVVDGNFDAIRDQVRKAVSLIQKIRGGI
jgi:2-keto-3-deoxy-6-phosphogluconate aldolase